MERDIRERGSKQPPAESQASVNNNRVINDHDNRDEEDLFKVVLDLHRSSRKRREEETSRLL